MSVITEMLTSTWCTEISAASVNTLVIFLKKSCPVSLNTSPTPLNLKYFKPLLVSYYVDASSQVHAALVGTAVLWAFMELQQVKYKSPMPNRPCSQQSILACPSPLSLPPQGSTCAMVESILRSCGYRTGLFTSPHLVDVRERIRLEGWVKVYSMWSAGILFLLKVALSCVLALSCPVHPSPLPFSSHRDFCPHVPFQFPPRVS